MITKQQWLQIARKHREDAAHLRATRCHEQSIRDAETRARDAQMRALCVSNWMPMYCTDDDGRDVS